MNLSGHQWQKLRELREFFLSAQPNRATYWDSEKTVELYDQTLAVRIGWRWDAVLGQLGSLRWQPGEKTFLDWGCGSGIAARKILGAFPHFESVYLSDLSPHAERYAAKTVRTQFPAVSVRTGIPPGGEPFSAVLSHVLGELDPKSEELLASTINQASSLVWVEGGSALLSKKLGLWRERLDWPVIAPCTHRQPCGMLAPENPSALVSLLHSSTWRELHECGLGRIRETTGNRSRNSGVFLSGSRSHREQPTFRTRPQHRLHPALQSNRETPALRRRRSPRCRTNETRFPSGLASSQERLVTRRGKGRDNRGSRYGVGRDKREPRVPSKN